MNVFRMSYCFIVLLLTSCGTYNNSPSQPEKSKSPISASTILVNGKIYTQNAKQPWAEAVAISNGKLIYVGNNIGVEKFRTTDTKVIDLVGKMAMPGLFDAHVHPVLGGTEQMLECLFPPTATPDVLKKKLQLCIEESPDKQWITGGRWDSAFFEKYNIASPKKWLDDISTEKAISLADDTGHNRWVNSKAMALAGLDKEGLEIPGGVIVKNEVTGETTGVLLETAMVPVLNAIPAFDKKDYLAAAIKSLQTANAFGITGIKEAGDSLHGLLAYKAADDAELINVHMAVAIAIPLLDDRKTLDVEKLNALRKNNTSTHVNTDFVKIFLDGVPSVARTAAMLADYTPEKPAGATHNGTLLFQPEILNKLMAQLDSMGITVNVHAAGDRSVRVVLDAIEYTRKQNGRSGLSHAISHAGFIDEADIPRFSKLNAVADLSPTIWFPSPITDSIVSAVGARGEQYFPIKSLIDNNASVLVGSDWPAVLPDMNPWVGMEAMITRQDPWGQAPGAFWPEQAITLAQALKIYTVDGARAVKVEQMTGSLKAGMSADIIVLNQHLFEISAQDISETKVELTLFEGKVVYQSK